MIMKLQIYFLIIVNRKIDIWLTILMVRFLVYINNKPKTDGRFLFCATVQLTKPYPPLLLHMIPNVYSFCDIKYPSLGYKEDNKTTHC